MAAVRARKLRGVSATKLAGVFSNPTLYWLSLLFIGFLLQEPDRYPREYRHYDQAHQQRQQIAPDRPDPLGRIDASDGAGGIIAYSERRREQSDAHRQDDDHGIMDLVDADSARDRKQQRAEQHDRWNALQHAAQHHEGQYRYRDKRRRAAGQAGHRGSERARKTGLRQAPGHAGGGTDDQQDRARQAGGFDQHRQQPPPLEAAIDQQSVDQESDHEGVDDADGGAFGCGGDALDHAVAGRDRQRQRRQRDEQGFCDLAAAGSGDVAEVLVTVAPPHQRRQGDRQHHARQQAAGEQCRDRDAGDRSDGDQHQARRNGFGLRAGGREQGDEIARLGAAQLHFRKQHGSDGGHVGGLRARYARHQIHRADQHVMQPAPDMAEQARQECHHGARHPGHLDQQAQKDEQRHRQQDQMAHALVHAADQHHQWRTRGQRQIAEDRQAKSERDRHSRKYAETGNADKEDDQIDVAERTQPWLRQPENPDQRRDRERRQCYSLEIAPACQPQQRKQRHQADAYRQRRRAPEIGDLQCRRGDEAFLIGILVRRPGDQQQERQRGAGRHEIEIGAHRRPGAGDDRGHPHVLGPTKCYRRTQHRQPEKQDRSQFVRPDQRRMQPVTCDHSGEQDDDFGHYQTGRRNLDEKPKRRFQRSHQRTAARGP